MNKLHQCPNLDYPYLAIPDIDEDTLDYLDTKSYIVIGFSVDSVLSEEY